MGDRRNVVLRFETKDELNLGMELPAIYLYVHWMGQELPEIVQRSIARAKDRWGDESYLARVIASDVFSAVGIEATTGAGLSLELQDTDYPGREVEVFLGCDMVKIGTSLKTFENFISTELPTS